MRLSVTESGSPVPPSFIYPHAMNLHVSNCFAGLAWDGGEWEGSWSAIKQVWASKWNERAVLSGGRAGLSHNALQMAVLCQEVVPAQYAFVAHTTNPTTGET